MRPTTALAKSAAGRLAGTGQALLGDFDRKMPRRIIFDKEALYCENEKLKEEVNALSAELGRAKARLQKASRGKTREVREEELHSLFRDRVEQQRRQIQSLTAAKRQLQQLVKYTKIRQLEAYVSELKAELKSMKQLLQAETQTREQQVQSARREVEAKLSQAERECAEARQELRRRSEEVQALQLQLSQAENSLKVQTRRSHNELDRVKAVLSQRNRLLQNYEKQFKESVQKRTRRQAFSPRSTPVLATNRSQPPLELVELGELFSYRLVGLSVSKADLLARLDHLPPLLTAPQLCEFLARELRASQGHCATAVSYFSREGTIFKRQLMRMFDDIIRPRSCLPQKSARELRRWVLERYRTLESEFQAIERGPGLQEWLRGQGLSEDQQVQVLGWCAVVSEGMCRLSLPSLGSLK